MLLNDKQIKDRCPPQGHRMIVPFIDHQEGFPSFGLGSCGYDIRLGETFKVFKADTLITAEDSKNSDLKDAITMDMLVPEGGSFCVFPHTTVMVESLERFFMPDDVMAFIVGKSTYTRLGLMISATIAEPGWRGVLKFSLVNPTAARIDVVVGAGIAQLVFEQIAEPDVSYEGNYQDQGEEPSTSGETEKESES